MKSPEDFNNLVACEDRLSEELGYLAEVDGHDFGKSEFNIFVLTDMPEETFQKAYRLVANEELRYGLRAAYRELTDEHYVILWPSTLREFKIS